MTKVILIDDEPLARQLVKEYLSAFKAITIVAECGDGFEAVKAIQTHNPDLIFLDIQMPKINGFETLELIEKKPAVIFTTAFDEYALKAFEQNAIDYLLKPFNQERFDKALNKFIANNNEKTPGQTLEQLESVSNKHDNEMHRVVVKNGSSILILPTATITHIEAYDDYVKIFNADTFYLKKKTMSYYEDVLDQTQFVRVHRSFILNLNHLTKIEYIDKNNSLALLKSGSKIPLSKTGYSKLKGILNL